MREKYESLSLATLKDLAKARGLKGVSALRKPELIERMLHEDELEGETKTESLRYFRMDMGLSDVRIIFRGKMIFMYHLLRYADLT